MTMRVLLDHRVPIGGVDRYARQLISAMEATRKVDIEVTERSLGPLTAPFTPWGRWFVGRRAEAGHFDIVHGLHFELPSAKLPGVVTISDLIPIEYKASLPSATKRWAFRRLVTQACERAKAIVVHSDLGKESVKRLIAPSATIHVIPIGVSPLFSPLTDQEKAAAQQRFGRGERYVASVYHRKPHKNMANLDLAARILSASSSIRTSATGSAPTGGAIHGVGLLSDHDLRLFFGGAVLAVIPSVLEGYGLPAVEAAACGTPVVAGHGLGAAPYLGSAVLVTDVTDHIKLANAIKSLIDDPIARAHMAEAGIEAAAGLSIGAEAAAHIEVYERVLGRSR